MENYQLRTYQTQTPIGELKESIRDMVQLQRDYQISDELFWEIFNARVLLNEKIDMNTFLVGLNTSSVRA